MSRLPWVVDVDLLQVEDMLHDVGVEQSVDEVDGAVVIDELEVEDDGCCPGHNWNDEGNADVDVVLPLDFVVGVDNGAPMASCEPMTWL